MGTTNTTPNMIDMVGADTAYLRKVAEDAITHLQYEPGEPGTWMHVHDEDNDDAHLVAVFPGPGSHIGLRWVAEVALENGPLATYIAEASPNAVLALIARAELAEYKLAKLLRHASHGSPHCVNLQTVKAVLEEKEVPRA